MIDSPSRCPQQQPNVIFRLGRVLVLIALMSMSSKAQASLPKNPTLSKPRDDNTVIELRVKPRRAPKATPPRRKSPKSPARKRIKVPRIEGETMALA